MITIVDGDLLDSECKVIAHQVNCLGTTGEEGLGAQIKNKYKGAFEFYYSLCNVAKDSEVGSRFLLGQNLECLSGSKYIVHMFSSYACSTDPLAFASCLITLKSFMEKKLLYEVALPYGIGCGLAGGNWYEIYSIIEDVFASSIINCKLYQLGEK